MTTDSRRYTIRSAALLARSKVASPARLATLLAMGYLAVVSCETLFTKAPTAGNSFESPFPGLPNDLNAMFARGDENFGRVFVVTDGLGPLFNNTGCGGCHSGDGRGTPLQALVRFSQGADPLLNQGGPQLQDKAIPGVHPELLPLGADRSLRMPPQVFGMGLLETIPESVIIALADPTDADADSISGRPNWVLAAVFVPDSEIGGGPGLQLGRFGLKANVSSLLEQVVNAYHQDIGITSDFLPVENPHPQSGSVALGDRVPDPEIPASDVLETMVYVRLLAPPAQGESTPDVQQGRALFSQLKCSGCHVPALTTGFSPVAALDQVEANLYSDLLIHDLGPGLADNRPDGDASGSEWRTAPLWGLRLVRKFLNGQVFLLHDGRARSIDEAIRLHGGEAQRARDLFIGLSATEQAAVIAFLETL